MYLSLRKEAPLLFAALAVGLVIAAGAALAHDDREVGDYLLNVGFRNEPAVEGLPNGIELKVEKKAESGGHHAISTGVQGDGHGSMNHDALVSEVLVEVGIDADPDEDGGVMVHIVTEGWRWAPENVNGEHVPGEGHAHAYVDDEKVNRVYGPYYYLSGLAAGERHIRVTLNANSHNDLVYGGAPVEASAIVTVAEAGHMMGPSGDEVESPGPITLEVAAHPDPLGGYNLQVVPTGFEFSGGGNEPGKGYAYVSIDGEVHARMYEPWLKLPGLEAGMHTISVVPVNGEGRPYSSGAASVTVHVEDAGGEMAMESGDHHHGTAGADGTAQGDGHHASTAAVEGLEHTLQVEVTHVASGVSRTLPLRSVLGEPGVYIAELIPTAPGVYTARFFGAIEGNLIDETFESGPGRFHNVESASDLHFPRALPTVREIEGAVRGAQSTAEQAQDAAIEAKDGASGAQVFGILGLVMGLAGVTMGAAGLAIALRRR